ncbi:MAG: 2,3-bisphosphoglycerate-independent phosphoglycerate mutase, partial [Candidatus Nanopelagicales bacterium]
LVSDWPTAQLTTSGEAVGLPDGQMGNSEVGHLNLGAGRIVYQDLTRISLSIRDKSFFEVQAFKDAIAHAKSHSGRVHLMGLLSDGGVHSHIDHVIALMDLCRANDIQDFFVHCFMDGRDTSPTAGQDYLQTLKDDIAAKG